MTQVYIHCSSVDGVRVDHRGSQLEHPSDARAHAERFARAMMVQAGPEDWREWFIYVSDAQGEEIVALPFASLLGQPH